MKGKRTGWSLSALIASLLFTVTVAEGIVKVATYNLRNYLEEDRMVDGRWRQSYPKPEKEKAALRTIIREVNPDILAVQEMGPEPYLLELQRDLEREGVVYPYATLLQGSDENRHLALLSRLPFETIAHDAAQPDFPYFGERLPVKRGILEARFRQGGGRWHLFVVHLKSRYTDNPEDPESALRRRSEARATRDVIRNRLPPETDPRYLVLGDFNDSPVSSPVRHFLSVSGRILTRIVPAADSRGETWTHFYAREEVYSRVDFVLASPAMLDCVKGGRGRVIDLPGALQASDHRMVVVEIEFTSSSP